MPENQYSRVDAVAAVTFESADDCVIDISLVSSSMRCCMIVRSHPQVLARSHFMELVGTIRDGVFKVGLETREPLLGTDKISFTQLGGED